MNEKTKVEKQKTKTQYRRTSEINGEEIFTEDVKQ